MSEHCRAVYLELLTHRHIPTSELFRTEKLRLYLREELDREKVE
jgi:hypothetical protein